MCAEGDLNPHALAGTATSTLRVCQFRHPRAQSGSHRISAASKGSADYPNTLFACLRTQAGHGPFHLARVAP